MDFTNVFKNLAVNDKLDLTDNLCRGEDCMMDWQCESFSCNTRTKNKVKNYLGTCDTPYYKATWFIILMLCLSLTSAGGIWYGIQQYKKNLMKSLQEKLNH